MKLIMPRGSIFICVLGYWLLAWITVPAVHATHPKLHPELDRVKEYTPILWLAIDERLHPMIPHPFAFDDIDNDGNGLTDLEDLGEVCVDSWNLEELSNWIEDPCQLPPPRVIYYDDPVRQKGNKVYQYWFYYLFDQGLGAHKHDAEHAFVYVDECCGEVKCFVGSGHTSATANNILVAGDPRRTDRNYPKRLPNHMPVLVELGKHASAPDRNFDGRFDLGMDANVFVSAAWGSRDILTATDTIDIGEFEMEHSYPRHGDDILVEKGLEKAWQYRCTGESNTLFCPPIEGSTIMNLDQGEIPKSFHSEFRQIGVDLLSPIKVETKEIDTEWLITTPGADYRVRREGDRLKVVELSRETVSDVDAALLKKHPPKIEQTYQLFPLEDMHRLHEYLAIEDYDQSKKRTEAFLRQHKVCFWGRNPKHITVDDEFKLDGTVFHEMRKWVRHRDEKRDVWLHRDHREPENILKLWLFPRMSAYVIPVQVDTENLLTGLGFQFTNIWPSPIKSLLDRNTVGIHTTFDWSNNEVHDVDLVLSFLRGVNRSVYAGIGWGQPKLSWQDIKNESYFVVSGGMMPIIWDAAIIPLVNHLLGHAQIAVRVGLRGEIHGPRPLTVDPISVQVGIDVIKKILGPRHPLDYTH